MRDRAVPLVARFVAASSLAWACAAQAGEPTTADVAPEPGIGLQPYVLAQTDAFTNGLPIFALDGDWSRGYTPTGGDLRGFEVSRAELGLAWGGWRIGATARAEAYAHLSDGAGRLAYLYQSRGKPREGEQDNADAEAWRWVGQGLTLRSADAHVLGWRLGASVDLLRVRKLRFSESSGTVGYSSGNYNFDVTARDDSPSKIPPYGTAAEPSGRAASLSLAAGTQWGGATGRDWTLQLRADNAWSRIEWDGVNSEVQRINSNTAQLTPDGYVDYAPLIQGRYTRARIQHSIPVNLGALLRTDQVGFGWSIEASNRYGLTQGWFGIGAASTSAFGWQVRFEPWAHAYELGLAYAGLQFSAGADRLDSAAHVRRASLAWNAPL